MRYPLFVLLLVGAVRADDQVFSGPQPGEKLTGFKAVGVYDDQEGKERDVIKDAAGKPLLLIFVHDPITRPAYAVIRGLSKHAAALDKAGLKTAVVWLAPDRTNAINYLKNARKSLNLDAPLVSLDGVEGPGAYGLNRKVSLTILVGKDGKVTANFALTQPALTDGPKITEAIAKQVGGKGLDLKAFETLAMGARAAQPQTDPQLGELMRALINKTADADDVKKVAEAVEKYAGTDRAKQKEVARIAGVIVEKKYGTEAAQKRAKALVEKYGR